MHAGYLFFCENGWVVVNYSASKLWSWWGDKLELPQESVRVSRVMEVPNYLPGYEEE